MRLHQTPLLILLCFGLTGLLAGAQSVDPLGVLLARPDTDGWLGVELQRLLSDMTEPQRLEALKRIGGTHRPALAAEVLPWMDDRSAVVAIAAIDTLIALWPTTAEHAEMVRAKIANIDDGVTSAAIRFVVHVVDDRAVPELARRLQRVPADAQARDALRRLSGKDFPDGGDWLAWYDERIAILSPLIKQLGSEAQSPDQAVAIKSVQRLMGLKEQASAVAELLLVATEHPAVRVRDMAKTGLRLVGGPVAACWRPPGEEPVEPAAAPTGNPGATLAIIATPMSTKTASSEGPVFAVFAGLVAVLAAVFFALRSRSASPTTETETAHVSTRIIRRRQRMTWLH